ncbi:MAG: proton-conducting transporter membrane subunit [Actinomycetales bacterium]|nr:proton-conducting transporter membrane subunit [Actinomycetales bacterium]
MAVLVLLPLVVSLVLAVLTAALRTPLLCRYAGVLTAATVLASGVALSAAVLDGATPTAGDLLRVDALSAFMLAVVGAVGLTATWGGLTPPGGRTDAWTYSTLVALFLGAMSLAVLADNLGVLWVAVEATTIATAFLVGHRGTRTSLEAAWKYVVLGSVGVAIAFLGLVLLYAATVSAGRPTLSWIVLTQEHLALDPSLVKVAGALAVLGFATKAGLAPMHSWLPDAHSQAPAPVSGLMSGVLLSVAFYAILRVQAVVDPVLGPGLMRGLLATAGLLSLAVAAGLVVRQRDLKRMLAYSSIEHMGLLALAAAAGGTLALAAALLHVLGHGLAKSSLFVVSGRILATEGTTRISGIRGLLVRRPGVAVPYLAGMAALLGLPPFSLFFSEVAIVVAGFQRGLGGVMVVAVGLVLVLFAGLARHSAAMTMGGSPDAGPTPDGTSLGPQTPLVLALGATAVVGLAAGPLATLLAEAGAVLAGAR